MAIASVEVRLMPMAWDWRRASVALKASWAKSEATLLPMLPREATLELLQTS